MRYMFVTFIISLFMFGIVIYLLDSMPVINQTEVEFLSKEYGVNTNTKFLEVFNDLQDRGLILNILIQKNFWTMDGAIFLFVASSFATIHLFIDKLFFRKFYEQPNLREALVRGVLIAVMLDAVILSRVFGLFSWLNVAFLVFIYLIGEYFYFQMKHPPEEELNGVGEKPESISKGGILNNKEGHQDTQQ